jgi:hypothetical protein
MRPLVWPMGMKVVRGMLLSAVVPFRSAGLAPERNESGRVPSAQQMRTKMPAMNRGCQVRRCPAAEDAQSRSRRFLFFPPRGFLPQIPRLVRLGMTGRGVTAAGDLGAAPAGQARDGLFGTEFLRLSRPKPIMIPAKRRPDRGRTTRKPPAGPRGQCAEHRLSVNSRLPICCRRCQVPTFSVSYRPLASPISPPSRSSAR